MASVSAPSPATQTPAPDPSEGLPEIDAHPHARAVLGGALGLSGMPARPPSHAYLLHGPAGSGKRGIARAFAGALLADGAPDDGAARAVRDRVQRGTHPDLTWVKPSGAAEMLVSDIDESVVAAAARTPFEASRRVFVIEGAETLNEQAANRLLKTLEEPPAYRASAAGERPPGGSAGDDRIAVRARALRCAERRDDRAGAGGPRNGRRKHGARVREARLGDAGRARMLAGEQGQALRSAAESYVRSALVGETGRRRWTDLLQAAKAAGAGAGEELGERLAEQLELAPSRERKKLEREAQEGGRRAERRARARALDQGLQLAELWLRDVVCVQAGAEELVYAVDRMAELKEDAESCAGARRGVELVCETRTRIAVNVSEELALEALAYRLQALVDA